ILTRCSWCGAPSTRRACATRARSSRPPGCAAKSRARAAAPTPPRLPARRFSNAIIPNASCRLRNVRPSRRRRDRPSPPPPPPPPPRHPPAPPPPRLPAPPPPPQQPAPPRLDRLPSVRAREAAVKADLAVVGKALATACGTVREGEAADAVVGGGLGGVDEASE